jgi:uncharacterized protein YndB with AHSA1/START domain
MFRITVNFTDVKGKTRMDMTMAFDTPEAAMESRKFIKKASGYSTWDRLAEYLTQESSGKDIFVINRSFYAPIETLFDVWTDPEHMAHWATPKGSTMKFIQADIKPGGTGFYSMTGGGGTMYGKTHYLEITRPNRIVYTQQFCDEKGKVTRHPMSPTWPETMLTTVLLASEGPDQTRVTLTLEPYGKVVPAEIDTFVKARTGMTGGWTGSFDQLDEYLVEQQGVKA